MTVFRHGRKCRGTRCRQCVCVCVFVLATVFVAASAQSVIFFHLLLLLFCSSRRYSVAQSTTQANAIKKALRLRSIINNYTNGKKNVITRH